MLKSSICDQTNQGMSIDLSQYVLETIRRNANSGAPRGRYRPLLNQCNIQTRLLDNRIERRIVSSHIDNFDPVLTVKTTVVDGQEVVRTSSELRKHPVFVQLASQQLSIRTSLARVAYSVAPLSSRVIYQ